MCVLLRADEVERGSLK